MPVDRWSLQPSSQTITEFGPDFGKPESYSVVAGQDKDIPTQFGESIHHSRVLRFEGVELPYYQKQYEMGWGLSVVESFHDRLVAFDSTTLGMAQMVYKAHLRTYKMKDLRKNIASGGMAFRSAMTNIDLVRRYQSMEGMSLIDSEDEIQVDSYTFGGLSDVLIQMSQQVAGALQIPLVKLFGMSPVGFSTGESDLRSYNDNIHMRQERDMRHPVEVVANLSFRSEFGMEPPAEFGFEFAPLYGLNATEKAQIAQVVAAAVTSVEATGVIGRATTLRELKAQADTTGYFGSITDEDIAQAELLDKQTPTSPDPPVPEMGEPDPLNESAIPGDDENEPKLRLVGGSNVPSSVEHHENKLSESISALRAAAAAM